MSARAVSAACLAALVLSACGGGSSTSSSVKSTPASTTPASTTPAATTPASTTASTSTATGSAPTTGSFTTVIPNGFKDDTHKARGGVFNFLYLAIGPGRTNINVVREHSGGVTDLNVIAQAELSTIKRILPKAHSFSQLGVTTLDGTPARTVDYLNSQTGRLLRQRQVFASHGGWVYVITYTAVPALYSAHLDALNQVISGWHWT